MPLPLLCLLAARPAAADPPALTPLIEQATAANPSLAALAHRADALRARAEVAGAWPDPRLSVEYANAPITSFTLTEHPMSGVLLRLEQTLRPPGWSASQRRAGEQRAEAEAHLRAEAELEVARAVRAAWWALARTRLLAGLTEAQRDRAGELLAAVRTRYETGREGQHAVLQLELLRERLTDDLGDFAEHATGLGAALRATLGGTPEARFATPEDVSPRPPPPPADWRALAAAHHPRLAALRAEQAAALEAARGARLEGLPDPTVWAGYRVRVVEPPLDPGTDFVSLGLAVPLPAGSARRARGERAAALEGASASEARHQAALDELEARMTAVVARWQRAATKAATYDERLLPAARATLQTTRSDFAVDRADFASLFDAEVALLDLERARLLAAVETHLAHADAVAALGVAPPGGPP